MFYKPSNGENMIIKHEAIEPIKFDKVKIIDYTAGQDISSSFAEITVPVGVSHKLSWSNRSDKYYYVVQGRLIFTVNNESNSLSSGDVCIIGIALLSIITLIHQYEFG